MAQMAVAAQLRGHGAGGHGVLGHGLRSPSPASQRVRDDCGGRTINIFTLHAAAALTAGALVFQHAPGFDRGAVLVHMLYRQREALLELSAEVPRGLGHAAIAAVGIIGEADYEHVRGERADLPGNRAPVGHAVLRGDGRRGAAVAVRVSPAAMPIRRRP